MLGLGTKLEKGFSIYVLFLSDKRKCENKNRSEIDKSNSFTADSSDEDLADGSGNEIPSQLSVV